MTVPEQITFTKKFIKYIEKGYGKKVCAYKHRKDYHPDCINCQAQWALGWMRNHLSLLTWEMDQRKKDKKKVKHNIIKNVGGTGFLCTVCKRWARAKSKITVFDCEEWEAK